MGAKGTVSATFSLLLSLVLFFILCEHQIRADGTVGIVCYGYDGASYVNNTKCPGSNACCGYEATCVSNRLCHNPGDAEGTYVRGPCANDVWDSTCAQFPTDETLLSGFLPRVSQCSDGSWCCSYDATCCSGGRGVFLDSDGNSATAEGTATTSYPPVSGTGLIRYTESASTSTSSTISASTTSSGSITSSSVGTLATTSATSATDISPTSGSSSDDDDDSGTKVGLGVGIGLGIPLAAIVAGGSVWFFLRRKKRQPHDKDPSGEHMSASHLSGSHMSESDGGRTGGTNTPSGMYAPVTAAKIELSAEGRPVHELQSLSSTPGYQRSHYADSRSPDPQTQSHTSYELP
ncbi:hypothetical protein LA080_007032 [Diaporthe eres]|nr:hypothetical protein LA080_007032 [Diaporthe eres]